METLYIFTLIIWGLLLTLGTLYPHRLSNSLLLMAGLFLALLSLFELLTGDFGMSLFIAIIGFLLILLLVPFMLIINGITMLKKEGRSFANLLSLFLGIIVEIGELSFFLDVIFNYSLGIAFFERMNLLLLFTGVTVFYFSSIILLFVLYMIYFQFMPHRYDFEYIIIHGCGLIDGEKVSKLLSNRIDKAIKVYHKGKDKAMLICSGGKGSDEKISEAEAISRYLKEKGIPEDHILLEDGSTTTEENLINSYEIITSRGDSSRIALVSSSYHIYRCVLLARRLHIPCVGIGAKVAWYYWPSAVIREFVAVYLGEEHLIWIVLGYLMVIAPFIFVLMGR